MRKVIREVQEDFDSWFIRRERDRVADFCQDITEHLRAANIIWPTNMSEFEERRLEMDRALVCCNKLQDKLQYIAETLPADKNKFMNILLEVQSEYETIKKEGGSIDLGYPLLVVSAACFANVNNNVRGTC